MPSRSPYLLVGHSLGGLYARHYATRFPGEVAALLVLDPAHEDYDSYCRRSCARSTTASTRPRSRRPLREEIEAKFRLYADFAKSETRGEVCPVEAGHVTIHLRGDGPF